MIVYSVRHRFFSMKNDAETYRKAEGLPVGSTHKLVIENREELAAFLDGLFQYAAPDNKALPDPGQAIKDAAPYVAPEAEDWVPEFIKRDWERRASYSKEK